MADKTAPPASMTGAPTPVEDPRRKGAMIDGVRRADTRKRRSRLI
jgi:hypothetical protein